MTLKNQINNFIMIKYIMNSKNYILKYIKYKTKINTIQFGGAIDFRHFPCSIYHAFDMNFSEIIEKC